MSSRQKHQAADGPDGQEQPETEKRHAADAIGNGEEGLQHGLSWGRLEQPVVDQAGVADDDGQGRQGGAADFLDRLEGLGIHQGNVVDPGRSGHEDHVADLLGHDGRAGLASAAKSAASRRDRTRAVARRRSSGAR